MTTTTHSRRNRVAAALAGLALIGVGGIATSALFTDKATVQSDARTGTLAIEVGGTKSYDLDQIRQTVYAPNVTASEVVEIANTGAVRPIDARVDITKALSGDTDLAPLLDVEVVEVADASGTALPGGDSANVVFAEDSLDTLQIDDFDVDKGESRFLKFTVTMPEQGDTTADSVDNDAQGKSVAITLTALAEQRL